ncbi:MULTISPECIES: hypothetical protein [unclassified Streptomyces]|uniref:hypothetical protein n=1 Tax=unclassified Streptomyces TaxID=2593676 RepID=UPI0037FD97AF
MARTFPDDLLQAQREWHRTYAALAERPVHTTALRRRLQVLSRRIETHPFFDAMPGGAAAARVELRRQARMHGEGETA